MTMVAGYKKKSMGWNQSSNQVKNYGLKLHIRINKNKN